MIENLQIHPKTVVVRNKPANLNVHDEHLFISEYFREIPKNHWINIGAIMIVEEGLLVNRFTLSKYCFFDRTIPYVFNGAWYRFKQGIKNYVLRNHRSESGTALWVVHNWAGGYFHWMTEVMPLLETFPKAYLNQVTFILPGFYEKLGFVKDSLKYYDLLKVDYVTDNEIVAYDQCITYSSPIPTGNYVPDLIGKIRNRFHINEESNPDLKLFISRMKASKRKIENEMELIPILKKYGYRIVYFEEMDLNEQVKLSTKARVMISIHGAGLTNMMFMHPGTHLVEIRRTDDKENNCYFSLASVADLHYYYLLADSALENNHPSANVYVYPTKFEELLVLIEEK